MSGILILSRDAAVIAMYCKLAKRLDVRLVSPSNATTPLPEAPVLADADSYPTNLDERADLGVELCAHAANAPTDCFGYQLSDKQRAGLAKAGVMVAHRPGRILFWGLASWGALSPDGTALAPKLE